MSPKKRGCSCMRNMRLVRYGPCGAQRPTECKCSYCLKHPPKREETFTYPPYVCHGLGGCRCNEPQPKKPITTPLPWEKP